jgi:D-inositol-3-phosphate glycosyltransferase
VRVLLVSAYYLPHLGGIERFTQNLARGLVSRGHDVHVLCCRTARDSPLEQDDDGVRVHRVPAGNPFEQRLGVPWPVPAPFAVVRAVRRLSRGVDVVLVNDILYATSIAALLFSPAPVVLTQHVGVVPQRNRALELLERLAYRATRRTARRAAAHIAYNPQVAAWASRLWGADVRVLPVGSGFGNVDGSRAEFGLPEDRFVALFVGRDTPKKRLDVVLDAADERYELAVVTGREQPPGPRRGVRFFPPLAPDRLGALMRCVDAFVLPSHGEGIPLSLQEAMAAGLPVVTTLNPGYEAYFSAQDVLAVEPDASSLRNALGTLAGDEALRRRLAARSAEVARRHFDPDRFVDAYEEQLRVVHSAHPRPVEKT